MTQTKQKRRQLWLSQLLFGLSLICLAFGLAAVAWVVWPPATETVQYRLPAGMLPGAPGGTDYASLADYTLTVEWPRRLRLGQTGELGLSLVEAEGAGTAAREAQVVLVEPVIVGLVLDPPGLMQVNKAAGHDLALDWTLTAPEPGEYDGKIYVSFGYYDAENERMIAVPVAVADVDVNASAFLGLNAQLTLWFGLVALVLWGALFVLGRVAAGK